MLVVEDSTKMANLLRRGLEEQGYAVDAASDAASAIWLAQENTYDAIVLDIVLAGSAAEADGFDVCRRIRDAGRWAPVLMLTARDAIDDRVRGLDAGADDYLTKPFAFDELLARVRALIRRGDRPRPARQEVGDLVLDPATHSVRRGETRIDLTAKEFALLEIFMANAGRVLTRTDLIQHAWDFAFEGDSNFD